MTRPKSVKSQETRILSITAFINS